MFGIFRSRRRLQNGRRVGSAFRVKQRLISLAGIAAEPKAGETARGTEARTLMKGSILTAVESRLTYGPNIVNCYFAAFNRPVMALIGLALEKSDRLVGCFLEYL